MRSWLDKVVRTHDDVRHEVSEYRRDKRDFDKGLCRCRSDEVIPDWFRELEAKGEAVPIRKCVDMRDEESEVRKTQAMLDTFLEV